MKLSAIKKLALEYVCMLAVLVMLTQACAVAPDPVRDTPLGVQLNTISTNHGSLTLQEEAILSRFLVTNQLGDRTVAFGPLLGALSSGTPEEQQTVAAFGTISSALGYGAIGVPVGVALVLLTRRISVARLVSRLNTRLNRTDDQPKA